MSNDVGVCSRPDGIEAPVYEAGWDLGSPDGSFGESSSSMGSPTTLPSDVSTRGIPVLLIGLSIDGTGFTSAHIDADHARAAIARRSRKKPISWYLIDDGKYIELAIIENRSGGLSTGSNTVRRSRSKFAQAREQLTLEVEL